MSLADTTEEALPQSGFRPDIEGLRAVAVVAVVLVHAGMPGVSGGFIGVDVFFVISGFLITGMLWREASTAGRVRLSRFYGARARRLLPASAVVGVVTAIASAMLLPPLEVRSALEDGIACALYVGNYRFALLDIDYFAANRAPSPFQHYWSLGVEEQFYLLWPTLIILAAWLIRRTRRRADESAGPSTTPYLVLLALIAVASFTLSLADTRAHPPVAFFSLQTRAWELAVGGAIALTAPVWRRLPKPAAAVTGWSGLAVILFAYHHLSSSTPFPGTAALLPVCGAGLVIAAGCAAPTRGCGQVLGLAPMRAIGKISYSWYLWHWPVLVLFPPLLGHPMGPADRVLAVAISAGLALLTVQLIEDPIRFAASLRRSPRGSLAVGAAATAVATGVGLTLLIVVPAPAGRGPGAPTMAVGDDTPLLGGTAEQYNAMFRRGVAHVQAVVAGSAGLQEVPSNLSPSLTDAQTEEQPFYSRFCMVNVREVDPPDCASGDTASPTRVALVGDSNAAMWVPEFQQIAAQGHWRLETLAKVGCPLMTLPAVDSMNHRHYTECDEWTHNVVARLQAEHPTLVVLSVMRYYGENYSPAWIDGMTHVVEQLRGTGAQVLVLGPIPGPQVMVPTCLSEHLLDATACSQSRAAAVNQAGIAAESAATAAAGGQYASLTELFCTADRCPVIVNNTLVYFDWCHVSMEYAKQLTPMLGALADRTVARG